MPNIRELESEVTNLLATTRALPDERFSLEAELKSANNALGLALADDAAAGSKPNGAVSAARQHREDTMNSLRDSLLKADAVAARLKQTRLMLDRARQRRKYQTQKSLGPSFRAERAIATEQLIDAAARLTACAMVESGVDGVDPLVAIRNVLPRVGVREKAFAIAGRLREEAEVLLAESERLEAEQDEEEVA